MEINGINHTPLEWFAGFVGAIAFFLVCLLPAWWLYGYVAQAFWPNMGAWSDPTFFQFAAFLLFAILARKFVRFLFRNRNA